MPVFHAHDAGHAGDHCLHTGDEAADEHGLAAMMGEEDLASCDQWFVVLERPHFLDRILEEMADRIGDGVADNGADDIGEIDLPEGQASLGDDAPGHQQDRGRGDE